MKIDVEKVTPMMRQYLETKKEYSDCILFLKGRIMMEMENDKNMESGTVTME